MWVMLRKIEHDEYGEMWKVTMEVCYNALFHDLSKELRKGTKNLFSIANNQSGFEPRIT
jgi:hypothetical protein